MCHVCLGTMSQDACIALDVAVPSSDCFPLGISGGGFIIAICMAVSLASLMSEMAILGVVIPFARMLGAQGVSKR